jgi:hypothetical protein
MATDSPLLPTGVDGGDIGNGDGEEEDDDEDGDGDIGDCGGERQGATSGELAGEEDGEEEVDDRLDANDVGVGGEAGVAGPCDATTYCRS